MWKRIDDAMYSRRPIRLCASNDTLYKDRNVFWLIDGNVFPKPTGRGSYNLMTPSLPAPSLLALFDNQRNSTFPHNRILPLIAFRDLVANKIPERFPDLRFGFIEASAGWIPFLIHALRRLLRERWKFASSVELFRQALCRLRGRRRHSLHRQARG